MRRILGAAARLADSPFVALLLSAAYPAVFLFALNWYAFSAEKIVFTLLITAVAAMTAYLLIRLSVRSVFACLRALPVPARYTDRKTAISLLH